MSGNGSQRRWSSVRRFLNRSRAELTSAAAVLAADWPQLESGLIVDPGWLTSSPVPLEQVRLEWLPQAPPPRVTGTEPQSFLVRPLRDDGQPYESYAEALRDVDPPDTFEDLACYRLLDVRGGAGTAPVLRFGPSSYFQAISVAEAVAHELAATSMASANRRVSRTDLPLRTLVGEPGDLTSRSVVPAVCALTVRHDPTSDQASFLLHRRDPQRVASGGGLLQVAPVGVFQPAGSVADPTETDPDFDLWRCVAREYSEELLGHPQHHGVDYRHWPFGQRLAEAREKGGCRPYYLGVGIDPLTLVADLLMVVVFDAATFDEIFADLVTGNDEGELVSGIAFTEANVTRYAKREPMQPAGASLLQLAWQHRVALLA